MKDVPCKCKHMKSEHDHYLLARRSCKNCYCSSFLTETYPRKFSVIEPIIGILVICMLTIIFLASFLPFYLSDLDLSAPVEITVGGFIFIAMICVGGLFALTGVLYLEGFIFSYLKKKRYAKLHG